MWTQWKGSIAITVLVGLSGIAQAQQPLAGQQAAARAQQAAVAAAEPEAPRVVLQAETTASVLRLMKFSGLLKDRAGNPRTGAVGLAFALYKDQQGGSPLWLEVQNAQLDEQGRYTVLLGSTKSDGLPLELFSNGEARWLGVQLNLPGEEEQPRVLLVSVPYALKAADAETLGGKPPSAFLLAEKAEGRDAAEAKPEAGKEAVKESPPREGVVGPINGEGSLNMVAKFTGPNNIGNGSIFDNGFVGIGTASPTARLHIFEPEPTQNANVRLMGSGQTGSWMDIFAGTAVGFGLFGYGAQPFIFGVGAVERMRITPTGEVGLGTTSPNAKLSVGAGSIADASVPVQISTGTSGTVSYYGANKNGGYGLLFGYENGGSLGTGGVLRMVSSDPLLFVVNNTAEAMRITSAGNVGVGTAAPAQKLHMVSGTADIQMGTPNGVAGIEIIGSTAGHDPALWLTHTGTGGRKYRIASYGDNTNPGQFIIRDETGIRDQLIIPNTGGLRIIDNLQTGLGSLLFFNAAVGKLPLYPGMAAEQWDELINFGINMGRDVPFHSTAPGYWLRADIRDGLRGFHFFRKAITTGTETELVTIADSGNVGIGTDNPSSILSLGGEADRTFGMERRTVADTPGNHLTVQAGGATVGAIDKAGGTLVLSSGVSTGFAGSGISFLTATGGASGAVDRIPSIKMAIAASGNVSMFGNLSVSGTLTKGGGSFRIDHPLDPAHKYLSHSFVESPDMMNIYNGNARLDAHGEAWVELPEWLEALNRDFRYQLTALGAPAPGLHIAQEVSGNRFKIAGGRPGGRVSWQVTGIRKDAYANAYRIKVEEEKPLAQRGSYLHPELFGPPKEKSAETVQHPMKVAAAEK